MLYAQIPNNIIKDANGRIQFPLELQIYFSDNFKDIVYIEDKEVYFITNCPRDKVTLTNCTSLGQFISIYCALNNGIFPREIEFNN